MTDPYILQAREFLAAESEKQKFRVAASDYRKGRYDGNAYTTVIARILREHDEKQPTFEQRVEAMKAALTAATNYPYRVCWCDRDHVRHCLEAYDAALAEIMAPKPVDPLLEAVNEAFPHVNVEHLTEKLRKALAARNHEIREVQG